MWLSKNDNKLLKNILPKNQNFYRFFQTNELMNNSSTLEVWIDDKESVLHIFQMKIAIFNFIMNFYSISSVKKSSCIALASQPRSQAVGLKCHSWKFIYIEMLKFHSRSKKKSYGFHYCSVIFLSFRCSFWCQSSTFCLAILQLMSQPHHVTSNSCSHWVWQDLLYNKTCW